MRTRNMLALWASLLWAGAAAAQPYPADSVILQPEVEVRSGPSKNFYATSRLRQGDRVTVVGESKDPGWLEVKPPAGSFSWINAKYLEQNTKDPRYWRVKDTTSVLPGSALVDQAPNRESLKVSPGTIVVTVAHANSVGGETWLPIQPQPTEVRYIPTEAVRPTTATSNGPATWARTPDGSFMKDQYLAEAYKQEAAGAKAQAIQLYQYVVNTTTDPNSKVLAQNRLASLQQSPYGQVQGTTTSLSPANPAATAALSNLQTLKNPEWTAYGRLRDIKLQREDGQPIYAMEDAQGRVITYVTTNQGQYLTSYIGRWISVYGPTMYRPDTAARMPYVVASHVAVP